MASSVHRNNKGFTLVEVLVSMVILAVGLLGSLVAVKVALESTQQNAMRFEAVKIAQEQAEMARNMSYVSIQAIPVQQIVQRQIRKTMASFTVNTVKTPVPGYSPYGMTKLAIGVQWTQKNRTHSYGLETIVRETR